MAKSNLQAEPIILQSDAINDTWLRRALTICALFIFRRSRRRSTVLFLPGNICVKTGYFTRLAEAHTMRFVARHTQVPVPKVYCAFRRKNITYIVMETIDGEMLGRRWVPRSPESKAMILRQVKDLVVDLRNISAPSDGRVANVDGGELYDARLPAKDERRGGLGLGPSESFHEFHCHLRDNLEESTDHYPEINEMIAKQKAGTWPIVFTHGDLSSLNILVRGDRVVGIVDWETAGWWPSYWEYTTASNVNPQNDFWREEIDKFLEPMHEELAMERVRLRYFGDF